VDAHHGRAAAGSGQDGLPAPLGRAGRAATATGQGALAGLTGAGGMILADVAGVVVLVLALVAVIPDRTQAPAVPVGGAPPASSPTVPPSADDSLGLKLAGLTAAWNEVSSPPSITKGIPRTPETGRFDGFTFRFNESSLLAGAYDDRTEDLYALLVRSWLSDENAERLIIHLCHVVHPHNQGCLDSYRQVGLDGGTLEDFRDQTRQVEWVIDGVRWSLEIEENIQSIRALAPGAP